MKPNCIDISTWQQNVDFNKVKAAGVTAVIIRGGFSETKDNQFENHYRGARAAGLKIGAYWYSYAYSVSEAEKEAKACISVLSGKSFDLPVYYDMEESGQMALGMTALTNIACRFLDTLKSKGFRVGIYSSPSWFSQFLNYDLLKSKYSIWLAHWASAHSRACDIWQFGVGRVSGVSGDCDCNIIENTAVISGAGKATKAVGLSSVKEVQKWINKSFGLKIAEDGIYGNETRRALIKALQNLLNTLCKSKLEVDGIYGACTALAVRNLKSGSKGNLVKVLQGFLICHGYDTGGFDGIFGNATEAAVRDFQSRHGLYCDGIAGCATFGELAA